MIEVIDFKGDVWYLDFGTYRPISRKGLQEAWLVISCEPPEIFGDSTIVSVPVFTEWWDTYE